MTPGIDIRIKAIINGLTDVIFPAVDPEESLAVEQQGMIIAQLELILRQLPFLDQYHGLCRDDMRQSAERMMNAAAGGDATLAARAELERRLANPAPSAREDYNLVGEAVNALVSAVSEDGEAACRERIGGIMLEMADRQLWRDRVWCADLGFDPYPGELCSIEDMATGKAAPRRSRSQA